MKIRKVSRAMLFALLLIFELGIVLNSVELLEISILPALVLLLPNIPFRVNLEVKELEGGGRVGEVLKVSIKVRILGLGLFKIMHVLPDCFELLDGSNARGKFVVGRGTIELRYSCIPVKRGVYDLGTLILEAENLFSTRRVRKKLSFPAEKEVKSRIFRVRRFEMRRGVARKPLADIDISRVGVIGTDFREIRKYSYGDPMKLVNWKATAKLGELMVNDFEREGKKAVWIFLDSNPYMLHGDTRRNCFETAVEIASSLSYYFSTRGHKVGLYAVGHETLLYPESGRRQFGKIYSTLVKLDVAEKIEKLVSAVERSKKYIEAARAASIFITRAELSNPLKAGIKAMGKGMPVTVISVFLPGESLGDAVEKAMREAALRKLRRAGISVVEVEAGRAERILAEVVK